MTLSITWLGIVLCWPAPPEARAQGVEQVCAETSTPGTVLPWVRPEYVTVGGVMR